MRQLTRTAAIWGSVGAVLALVIFGLGLLANQRPASSFGHLFYANGDIGLLVWPTSFWLMALQENTPLTTAAIVVISSIVANFVLYFVVAFVLGFIGRVLRRLAQHGA